MNHTAVESVYLFGSAARMTTDSLSDRDVLVVASEKSRRDTISKRWRSRGWSVAAYSPRRILKMIAAGSLFVQHLRMEGVVVEDRSGWLTHHLRSAVPKQSYELDAQQSVSLALPLERLCGESFVASEMIASDLAYVAVRNFGVCHLADKNRLTFDYHQIVEHLAKNFRLGTEEVEVLKALRAGKAAYRSGRRASNVGGTVSELRDLLSKFFVARPLQELGQNVAIRYLGNGYSTLREFEVCLSSEVRRAECDALLINADLQRMHDMISNPRGYSWDVRNLSSGQLEMLRRRCLLSRSQRESGWSEFGRHQLVAGSQ